MLSDSSELTREIWSDVSREFNRSEAPFEVRVERFFADVRNRILERYPESSGVDGGLPDLDALSREHGFTPVNDTAGNDTGFSEFSEFTPRDDLWLTMLSAKHGEPANLHWHSRECWIMPISGELMVRTYDAARAEPTPVDQGVHLSRGKVIHIDEWVGHEIVPLDDALYVVVQPEKLHSISSIAGCGSRLRTLVEGTADTIIFKDGVVYSAEGEIPWSEAYALIKRRRHDQMKMRARFRENHSNFVSVDGVHYPRWLVRTFAVSMIVSAMALLLTAAFLISGWLSLSVVAAAVLAVALLTFTGTLIRGQEIERVASD